MAKKKAGKARGPEARWDDGDSVPTAPGSHGHADRDEVDGEQDEFAEALDWTFEQRGSTREQVRRRRCARPQRRRTQAAIAAPGASVPTAGCLLAGHSRSTISACARWCSCERIRAAASEARGGGKAAARAQQWLQPRSGFEAGPSQPLGCLTPPPPPSHVRHPRVMHAWRRSCARACARCASAPARARPRRSGARAQPQVARGQPRRAPRALPCGHASQQACSHARAPAGCLRKPPHPHTRTPPRPPRAAASPLPNPSLLHPAPSRRSAGRTRPPSWVAARPP